MLREIKKADMSLLLIALLGIGLSSTAFLYVKRWEYQDAIDDYKRQAETYVYTLRQNFTAFGNTIYSVNSLYHITDHFNRNLFSQFVKRQLTTQPAIQALEWVPYVPSSQRQEVEIQTQQDGIWEFKIWEFSPQGNKRPVPPRDAYYPVLFTEPFTNNLDSLGYDVSSNDSFKKALENSRDTGQITASGAVPVRFRHHNNTTLGFRIFVPVYKGDTIPQTIETRRHQLVGFAVGVFLLDSIAHTVLRLPKLKTEVFLRITDDTPAVQVKKLYSPAWYDESIRIHSTLLFTIPVDVGNRQWRLLFFKQIEGNFNFLAWYAWGVLGLGLLFTFGLWRYLYITLNRARWAENLVSMRTQSLSETNLALNLEIQMRERMTKALDVSRQRFEAIFNEAAIGIAQTDLNLKIIDSNRQLQTLLRYRENELQHRVLKELAHPEDSDIDLPMLQKMLVGKYDSYRVGKRYLCKNGAIVWTLQNCSIVRDTSQPFLICMIEDVTERKLAEEARLEAEKKYRDIFENAIEGIFQSTPTGQFLSVNPAFVRMFGYDSAEELCAEVTNIGQQLYVDSQRRSEFIFLLEQFSEVQGFEYQARCQDNSIIWVSETTRVVRDHRGHLRYYEGIVEDVTQRKVIEEKLRYDATHDQLTGLFNRAAFTAYLTEALTLLHATDQSNVASDFHKSLCTIPFAVLFLDLDRFKIVNDSMGHLVGDKLLTEISHRLHSFCKYDFVARFGGDEFALLLEKISDLSFLEQRASDVHRCISEPYVLKGLSFNTTASIGVALVSSSYVSADEVLRDADTAMFEAKRQGRGKTVIFTPGMHTQVVNILRMETDLRSALDNDQFCLYYQPIISLETFQTVGLEALVRWQHPQHGLISPNLFIPLAEETGLIKELGLWVFETACTQLRLWQSKFLHHANLGVNINVSAIQLRQFSLVNQIQDIIERTGISGPTCRIEITESAMMQDPEAALNVLNELKSLNVLLYVDDFGTGYSSLSYLQRFPIDALKIDKSFIQEIDSSGKSVQIVQAIIGLGNTFGLRVVAEGVEYDYQVAMLKEARCHQVQGYFFSRPKDVESMEEYLKNSG